MMVHGSRQVVSFKKTALQQDRSKKQESKDACVVPLGWQTRAVLPMLWSKAPNMATLSDISNMAPQNDMGYNSRMRYLAFICIRPSTGSSYEIMSSRLLLLMCLLNTLRPLCYLRGALLRESPCLKSME